MEKRIELERRGKDPKEVTELNLDNCRSTNIVGLTDEFENLEVLSLINVGLTTLKGFPKLPSLKRLELSDNRIANGLNFLTGSTELTRLNLSGNKIKDLETLETLKEFKNLQYLDLFNNEVTSIENYREKIFSLIPNLNYLDGFDAENGEAEDSDEIDEEEADGEVEVNGNGEDSGAEGEEDDDEGVEGEGSDVESGDEGVEGEEGDVDDEGSEEDEEADDDDDDDIGLESVYKDNLDEESEGEDYEGVEGEVDDEEDDTFEDDESTEQESLNESSDRGKKRKHEAEEDGE